MSEQAGRVTLVEDHTLFAQSLRLVLSGEGFDVRMVPVGGDSPNPLAALDSILTTRPDVVLLDLDLGTAGDGTVLVKPLTGAGHPVVVVTGTTNLQRWGECLAYGAHTVVSKSAQLTEITTAIRRVIAGRPAIHPARRSELIRHWQQRELQDRSVRARLDSLTRREGEVLTSLAAGKRVRDIATASFVSEATVRSQVKSILLKLGVTSQIAAVAMARDAGWKIPADGGQGE